MNYGACEHELLGELVLNHEHGGFVEDVTVEAHVVTPTTGRALSGKLFVCIKCSCAYWYGWSCHMLVLLNASHQNIRAQRKG